jgi:hypothetical protein
LAALTVRLSSSQAVSAPKDGDGDGDGRECSDRTESDSSVGLGQGVRAAQSISLPPASALQRHQLRTDYGGEHSAGSLEAVSFAISPASAHVCASHSRLLLSLARHRTAPSSALRYACLYGSHACHLCRTRPLLLIVPPLSPGLSLPCILSCCSCSAPLSHTSSPHNF